VNTNLQMFQIKLLYIYNIYEDKYNFLYNFKALSNSLERRYYKNVSILKKYIKTVILDSEMSSKTVIL